MEQFPRSSSPLFTPEQSPSIEEKEEFQNDDDDYHQSVTISNAPDYVEGFYHFNEFLSSNECRDLIEQVIRCNYFNVEKGRDQAMLFGMRKNDGLPQWAQRLLDLIELRLRTEYKKEVGDKALETLFNPLSSTNSSQDTFNFTRQFILNVYTPGQGIASHIDLPNRFLDGIMILSFGSGIAMDFALDEAFSNQDERATSPPFSLYLEPGSICILTGKSRWQWTHGIAARMNDLVLDDSTKRVRKIQRSSRFSITIRWLKIQSESYTQQEDVAQSGLRS